MNPKPRHDPFCRWNMAERCGCGLDALRARLTDREKRIKLASAAIPAKGFGVDPNSGEATHPYARVSERCILNVERYLDLRKPLSRRTKRPR